MSKLDRQLDEIKGIKRVNLVWPFTEEMYLDQIRKMLIQEIDSHVDRIPLDLRQVEGAPEGLVNLLFEMKDYAESKRKNLVVSYALEEMREALQPQSSKKRHLHDSEYADDASELAKAVLSENLAPIQSVHNSLIAQKQSTQVRPRSGLSTSIPGSSFKQRMIRLAIAATVGTMLVVGGYWYYLFKVTPDIVGVEPVHKSFED